MGFDELDVIEEAGGGGKSLSTSDVSCSICLEPVTDNGDRAWAKLQCGHEFHLDHDPLGQHAVFAEHTAVPFSTHPCPYVSYCGPIHSSSSSSVGSVAVGSNFSSHWGGPSGSSEMPTFSVTAVDPHYHKWEHHSLSFLSSGTHLVGPDQPSAPPVTQRSSRANSDSSRSGSFIHPSILSHSSAPYRDSVARARDHSPALQAYFQPPGTSPPMHTPVMISARRSNTHQGVSQVGPLLTSSDETASFCVFPTATASRNYPEIENPMTSQFQTWERDCPANFLLNPHERDSSWAPWGGFHPPTGGSCGFRQRHWSSRNQS